MNLFCAKNQDEMQNHFIPLFFYYEGQARLQTCEDSLSRVKKAKEKIRLEEVKLLSIKTGRVDKDKPSLTTGRIK